MGIGFKEVAYLRGDDSKFKENFNKIDWSAHNNENHIVTKLTEETEKKANQLGKAIKSGLKNESKIHLRDGDLTIGHIVDYNGDFVFSIKDSKQETVCMVDMDKFDTINDGTGLLADAFIAMYFEILHRDHIEELENQK